MRSNVNMKICGLIQELIEYGISNGLIDNEDSIYVTNRLMELFGLLDFNFEETTDASKDAVVSDSSTTREIHQILNDMLDYASDNGLIPDDSITQKDLFDTKIMGLITPMPSVVRKRFRELYKNSSKEATDYYYQLSKATNYIREDRIKKDEKWVYGSDYGDMDITINLSKPEKDPRDIAKAGQTKASGYPACLLCKENEGYSGHISHPARQNHRIIPIVLKGQQYFLQYSPYVYYSEHCIIFNNEHIPMKIDKEVFEKLLDFVEQFPHYIAGSNADLPIVGGSILSHDHFQGGGYTFAMAKAECEKYFNIPGFDNITAGIVHWPMSVIRLNGKSKDELIDACDHILKSWREYTDEDAFIFSETDKTPHNTITPIARMRDGKYEIDLVLRNNITTEDKPWGVYHPTADLHHIKKENIGLIEVMGLAILPSRLKKSMQILEDTLISGQDYHSITELESHIEWIDSWVNEYNFSDLTRENIQTIIHDEIGKVFVKVLECAGVFKCDKSGRDAFDRFIKSL